MEDEWRQRVAAIDARLAPIANRRVDINDPRGVGKLRASRPLDEAGVRPETKSLLHELLAAYGGGDDARRGFIRGLFRTFRSFAWAATTREFGATPEAIRTRLLHFSVKDQGLDPRDATLWLDAILDDARRAGVAADETLREVAELSSDQDRYGWGSTRAWLRKRVGAAPPRRRTVTPN